MLLYIYYTSSKKTPSSASIHKSLEDYTELDHDEEQMFIEKVGFKYFIYAFKLTFPVAAFFVAAMFGMLRGGTISNSDLTEYEKEIDNLGWSSSI